MAGRIRGAGAPKRQRSGRATALLAAAATWATTGTILNLRTVEWFIGFSMVVLAILKLQNLETFSTMFLNYDLLAKRWLPHAYLYPFGEGLAGVLMALPEFSNSPGVQNGVAAAVFQWLHVFFGVLWIGLLYYFNFVQIPTMPEIPAELKPGVSKHIAPKALFYFRWGAAFTVLTGLILAGDKTLTKKVLTFHGILTARFATVFRGSVDWAGDIDFPLILKPPQEDASLGITQKSIVNDIQELLTTISSLQSEYQGPVLAEEFIDGREFYVGVIGNSDVQALPVGREGQSNN